MIYKKTYKDVIFDVINHSVMILLVITMAYPFIYVLNYSISNVSRIYNPLMLVPVGINFEAYKILLSDTSIYRALLISVSRSILGPALMLMITGMAGYVISRKDLIAGKFFRLVFLFTMYFSAGLIPVYLLMKSLHLSGTYWIYIIPGMVNAFNMILVKTYIENLPDSIEEAVYIDGGSEMDAYWKVIFPMCMPVNATIVLFAAIGHWNSFMDTQIYNAMNPELFTLQYVLYNNLSAHMNKSLEELKENIGVVVVNNQALKMAITMITIVPIMFVYPLLQKYFASGILIGSIKG